MTEDEDDVAFLARMQREAVHEADSGCTLIDTDDLRRLIVIAQRSPRSGARRGKPGPSNPIRF